MNREEKAAVIDQVATQIQEAEAIYAIDYRGISVTQVAELRAKLAEADASLRVVKNSLTELAADQAGAEHLKEHLEGPTAFTFVRGDAALAAKAIANFRKEYELLSFKGGVMGGEVLTADQIEDIAKLPGARGARRPPGGHPGLAGHRPGQRPEQPDPGPGPAARPDRRAGPGQRRGAAGRGARSRRKPAAEAAKRRSRCGGARLPRSPRRGRAAEADCAGAPRRATKKLKATTSPLRATDKEG